MLTNIPWWVMIITKISLVLYKLGPNQISSNCLRDNFAKEWPIVVSLSYLPNPSDQAGYDTRSIFKRSLTGLNSEFSFPSTSCFTEAEEPSLPHYLPIAGGRRIGFIPFPRVLVLCEMQSVSSRIWTCVAVSISYDDNHYTTGTSQIHCCIIMLSCW